MTDIVKNDSKVGILPLINSIPHLSGNTLYCSANGDFSISTGIMNKNQSPLFKKLIVSHILFRLA